MAYFFNIFFKVFGFLSAILLFILVLIGISSYLNKNSGNEYFEFVKGNKNSKNKIIVYNLNGPILNNKIQIANIANLQTIVPQDVKKYLKIIKEIEPQVLIISINSPGGTVSASNELHRIFLSFKKNNNLKIYFHTNEVLASGGYWASMAAEKIYASYGSLIGSIGVRGPDWFFYDQPTTISSGFLGSSIETKNGIKVFSQNVGQSKDLLNPFREPTKKELDHLKSIINIIYTDFINLVAKNRSIESNFIKNQIGGVIYNSQQAKENFLIDDVLSLDELINQIIKENKYNEYKIMENIYDDHSLFEKLFITLNSHNNDIDEKSIICSKLRTHVVSILSYQSAGC